MKILIFMLLTSAALCTESFLSVSFNPVNVGDNRLAIQLPDFKVITQGSVIKAEFIENSTQWIRQKNNLMMPRARMAITLPDNHLHLRYTDRSILLRKKDGKLYTELVVSLFHPSDIVVMQRNKKVGVIRIHKKTKSDENHLVDFSCTRWGLAIKGLEDELLTVGCVSEVLGNVGSEIYRVEVNWAAPHIRLLDGSKPPYMIAFDQSGKFSTKVKDSKGRIRDLSFSIRIPKRYHRFKTALGLGPYSFKSELNDSIRSGRVAPAFMLYGKLDLPQNTSIRMFDALIFHESLFNNFGFYFAYELANAFDTNLSFVPLLGIQGLTFRYDKVSYSEGIYPQGFEVVWRNAFNVPNFTLVYGMFISLVDSETEDYKNMWIRGGKKIFWELNYIDWMSKGQRATMWGLSVGFPFVSFL